MTCRWRRTTQSTNWILEAIMSNFAINCEVGFVQTLRLLCFCLCKCTACMGCERPMHAVSSEVYAAFDLVPPNVPAGSGSSGEQLDAGHVA